MNHTFHYEKPEFDMSIGKQIIEDQNVSVEKKHPVHNFKPLQIIQFLIFFNENLYKHVIFHAEFSFVHHFVVTQLLPA